ncbi:hypothetical protein ACNKHK_09230 [Shigella flexneri]
MYVRQGEHGGYATGNALAHAGVIGGADMTVEATLTKLHDLLSQGLDTQTIREAMTKICVVSSRRRLRSVLCPMARASTGRFTK